MIDKPDKPIPLSDIANAAFSVVAQDVLRRARETGTEIVLWKDNAVLKISPEEFERQQKAAMPQQDP